MHNNNRRNSDQLSPGELVRGLIVLVCIFLFGVGAGCAGTYSFEYSKGGEKVKADVEIREKTPATVPSR